MVTRIVASGSLRMCRVGQRRIVTRIATRIVTRIVACVQGDFCVGQSLCPSCSYPTNATDANVQVSSPAGLARIVSTHETIVSTHETIVSTHETIVSTHETIGGGIPQRPGVLVPRAR